MTKFGWPRGHHRFRVSIVCWLLLVCAMCAVLPGSARAQTVDMGTGTFGVSPTSNAFPMNYTSTGNFFTNWTPANLNNLSGNITEWGFEYASAFTAKTWGNVKVWFGETTNSALTTTANANLMANFNVGTPVLCYDAAMTLTSPAVGAFVRSVMQTPYNYSGVNSLGIYIEITGGSNSPGSNARRYSTATFGNFRVYNTASLAATGTILNNSGQGSSIVFAPASNPGIRVERGTALVANNSTDNVGIAATAGLASTISWNLKNPGSSVNLNITSISITEMTNCTASVTGTPPSTVPFGGTAVPLPISVTAGTGTYSFKVTILNNSQVTADQTFIYTVTGTGFVNTPPVMIAPTAPPGGQVSGTYPNFVVETISGNSLAIQFNATDVNAQQNLSITVATGTGGTLTPATAGLTTTLPATSITPGASPHAFTLAGTAASAGVLMLTASATDNAAIPGTDTINVTVKIGAKLDINQISAGTLFTRPNGRKDFYRGQTAQPITVRVTNNNPFPISLQTLTIPVIQAPAGAPVPGITLTLPSLPLTIPASTANMLVNATMDIASNAGGTNGMACRVAVTSATAVDPANPTTNPIIVILPSHDEFDLYDGPAPSPLQITTATLTGGWEGAPYQQSLVATGGLGSYTWSVDPASPAPLPSGVLLDPVGSAILPAQLFGTLGLTTSSQSPYQILFRVTDGAYVTTRQLTLTVLPLPPLLFPSITLAPGTEYLPYVMATPLTASGGTGNHVFGVDPSSADQLPAGLTLHPTQGVISGTPADGTQGTYTLTFTVEDGVTQQSQTKTLVIQPHALVWRGTTLPAATQTVAYSATLDAIGGTPPRTYSIESGSLPNGLSLSAATGTISGVPSLVPPTVGNYNLVFKVTDGTSASVTQAITLTVGPAAPIALAATVLPAAEVGLTYSHQLALTGGSQVYAVSVATGAPPLPAGLSLAAGGLLTGTPAPGTDGRHVLELAVNDGFQTVSLSATLPVLAAGAGSVLITEMDFGTGYIELCNTGQSLVDVSGLTFSFWGASSTSPLTAGFDTLPGASLLLPAEVVRVNFGGTAGGNWPNFSTGALSATPASSGFAVRITDIHGNALGFEAVGSINRSQLTGQSSGLLSLPASLATAANHTGGSDNYSFDGAAWTASASGTPGVYNSGLPVLPLAFVRNTVATARAGQAYSDAVLAAGGRPPYTFTLTAPAAQWLALSPSGEFSGTAPSVTSVSSVNVDVTVTDAATASVTATMEIRVAPLSLNPAATITVGTGNGQSFEGSVTDVPVMLARSTGVTNVTGFSFIITLPAATVAELDVVRVLPGPATLAQDRTVAARALGGNQILVTSHDHTGNAAPASFQDGVIAVIRLGVPENDTVMAPQGTYAVDITAVGVSRATPGVHYASGTGGQAVLQNYKPQDVNRDDSIDVVDVQMTVNIILALQAAQYPGQGDANEDTNIDVVDVQTIVNCILSSGC